MPLDRPAAEALGGYMGVYEVRRPGGPVVLVGYAGGASRLGLRGEVLEALRTLPDGELEFRYEVTTAYLSRFAELQARGGPAGSPTPEAGHPDEL